MMVKKYTEEELHGLTDLVQLMYDSYGNRMTYMPMTVEKETPKQYKLASKTPDGHVVWLEKVNKYEIGMMKYYQVWVKPEDIQEAADTFHLRMMSDLQEKINMHKEHLEKHARLVHTKPINRMEDI